MGLWLGLRNVLHAGRGQVGYLEACFVEVIHAAREPILQVRHLRVEVQSVSCHVAVVAPSAIFTQVGTSRLEQFEVGPEAVEYAFRVEIRLSQVPVAQPHLHLEVVGIGVAQPAEDVVVAVLIVDNVGGVVLLRAHAVPVVVAVVPPLSAGGVQVPHGEGYFLVGLFVVDAEVHVLPVVVGGQDGFHQYVVVHDDGQVEVLGKVIGEVQVGRSADEVDSVVERAPVGGVAVVLEVGVLHVILVPRLAGIAVVPRLGARIGGIVWMVTHEDGVAPVLRLPELTVYDALFLVIFHQLHLENVF